LRDFLCQTFFLAAQKESLTQAQAATITVKEKRKKAFYLAAYLPTAGK
jgi:hypothetical protein